MRSHQKALLGEAYPGDTEQHKGCLDSGQGQQIPGDAGKDGQKRGPRVPFGIWFTRMVECSEQRITGVTAGVWSRSRGSELCCYHLLRRRRWQPTPVLLPGESHGWRRLVGRSPWGRKESDTTEPLHFLSFVLSFLSKDFNS